MGSTKFLFQQLRVGYISQLSITKHHRQLHGATAIARCHSLTNIIHNLLRLQPISTVSNDNTSTSSSSSSSSTKAQGKPQTTSSSSLKDVELAKFSAIADTWWDSEGPFKPLHAMNPTRLAFIRSTLCRHFRKDPLWPRPLEGLKILDVGCGGGILSEPLARMGAAVTGVDAVEKNIKIARLHAFLEKYCELEIMSTSNIDDGWKRLLLRGLSAVLVCRDLDPVTSSIEYCCTTAEKLVEEQRKFDSVIALEVIEHVADPAEFCKSLARLTDPGGAIVVSTINRSMRSYATAIIAAEYILHWLPKGTHHWSSFLRPEELVLILKRAAINVKEMAGFSYSPLTGRWSVSDDISVNFIAFGVKNCQ